MEVNLQLYRTDWRIICLSSQTYILFRIAGNTFNSTLGLESDVMGLFPLWRSPQSCRLAGERVFVGNTWISNIVR